MKIIILSLLAIVIGIILMCEFAFTQSVLRFVSILGLICLIFGWAIFPFSIANYITGYIGKGYKFLSYLYLCLIVVVTTLLGLFFTNWFDEQENKLNTSGKLVKSVVRKVKRESRGKGADDDGNYVYYKFDVHGRTFEHSSKNDTLKVGDEIVILYLPTNPENHKIKSRR